MGGDVKCESEEYEWTMVFSTEGRGSETYDRIGTGLEDPKDVLGRSSEKRGFGFRVSGPLT